MALQVTPFIMLDGQAREAIRFYEQALGAEVVFRQTFGEAPDGSGSDLPAKVKDLVAHSVLRIGDAELFVADFEPDMPNRSGNQVNICITVDDKEQAEKLYESLQEGGQVNRPLGPIHFSPAYGIVTDKFGVMFQIFTRRPK